MPVAGVTAIVLAASLGYAVDLLDGFLLPALRIPSLRDLGVPSVSSLEVGTNIFNLQLLGQTLGALLLWGPLSDRRGRRKAMFQSIILYGLANVATAFAYSLPVFACSRFIAGIGLGGQLGAGIALISESIPEPRYRTIATTVVGTLGMLGVVAAGFLAKSSLSWRTDYLIGGILALLTLFFSFGTRESAIFEQYGATDRSSYWRTLGYLFRGKQLFKLLACTLLGAPVFFVIGLLVSGAPEFGHAMGMRISPTSADALVWTYVSIAVGNLLCGFITPLFQSRKLTILLFHFITAAGVFMLLLYPGSTPSAYYWRCAIAGLGIGSWASMVTNASEQWGTNVRGLVTITVPNFIRMLLFPISAVFIWLKPTMGFIHSAALVGFACIAIAMVFTLILKDGYKGNLAFNEPLAKASLIHQ
jgi:MFS family permease